ncbi:tetratricopeptide repeat-containing sulfotransferase family protein [Dyella sedimenti]|uniref:tetratricopeptide repeat-containing sulfotransferase family protein n=1 Tax=Dyella sedimenti TaxID=2919947 RepID=UPI001FA9A566|nr:sulfotransferase [Dyella sedimenti]
MTPSPPARAWKPLLETLAGAPEAAWLERGRALQREGDVAAAMAVFAEAAIRFPDSGDARLGMAGLCWQSGQRAQAEAVLRAWLDGHPGHAAATFLLVQCLREEGRLQAAADAMHRLFGHGPHDADTVIQAVEMLDDYGRQADAAAICEQAIAAGAEDPRLHAYAGMLALQLGQFERVRERYAYALARNGQAVEWNIPLGLASLQRYRDPRHPDLAFFHEVLQRPGLSERTRTATMFALGKAHDDLEDFRQAADWLRQANARAHAGSTWSRKRWRRSIEALLAAPPRAPALPPSEGWAPLFVVGVPRSGTTLLAERLSRYPGVRNRGELGWLQVLAQRLSLAPPGQRAPFEAAAAQYAAQLRQDDADGRWFIDKQPLNLLHVGLILALWPNARIIHCERHARDTALSLWFQSFHDPAHDYAYDLGEIATVIQDCRRLAAHWRQRHPDAFRTIHYEALVGSPEDELGKLAHWLGLPEADAADAPAGSIGTASVWQARQPVYTRSVGRWRHYAAYLPELLKIPDA